MAERLKSILSQTRWSLLGRAIVFAAAWWLLPYWFFLLVALYLYFVPPFQARSLVAPFFAILILAFIEPQGIFFAVILGAIFYYLLLIKDLLLIDRKSAHELLVIALSFFLLRDFYRTFGGGWLAGAGPWFGFLTAILMGAMASSFIEEKSARVAAWLLFLISWEFILLGLALPLDFAYQSAIVFLLIAFSLDLISDGAAGTASRRKLIVSSSVVFALLVIILASAKWNL